MISWDRRPREVGVELRRHALLDLISKIGNRGGFAGSLDDRLSTLADQVLEDRELVFVSRDLDPVGWRE